MSYENQICELYFLLHRNNIHEIGSRLTLLLRSLKAKIYSFHYDNNLCYLKTLYLLIGHIRDIYFGHGERDIAYMMIYIWYKFYPVLAIYAFHQFVISTKNGSPYGCWNDIKYFCKFIAHVSDKGIHDPLIDVAVSCANHQLIMDMDSHSDISNVSKWIPRENKIDWLFEKLVIDWFSRIGFTPFCIKDAQSNRSNPFISAPLGGILNEKKDLSYLKKKYRQMIVGISKRSSICDKPTIKNIFQSLSNSNSKSKLTINGTYDNIKGKPAYFHDNVFIGTYIKAALAIVDNFIKKEGPVAELDTCDEAIWLNHKWCHMLASFFDNKCSGGIPVIDISADISNESLYNAIGFACLVAIKSGLFRILLVSNTPIWIEFTNSDSICLIVNKIWSSCVCRSGSQFSVSFHFLMDAFSNTSIINTPIKLFIFSQRFLFDWNHIVKCLGNNCTFVFWNVGKDFCDLHQLSFNIPPKGAEVNGLDRLHSIKKGVKADFFMDDHKEILFVSGCNVALFSKFCNNKMTINGSYDFLSDSLHSERYKRLSDYFDYQTSISGTSGNGNTSCTSSVSSSSN
jgi:hypothetical protein